jgi:hypothetical protein
MILVGKYRATMDGDDAESTVTEMIIIDVIMFTHECSAPSARRILNAMLDEGDD